MYPTILEVSFICLLGIAVIGKDWPTCKVSPSKKKKKKACDRAATHALDGCPSSAATHSEPAGGYNLPWH